MPRLLVHLQPGCECSGEKRLFARAGGRFSNGRVVGWVGIPRMRAARLSGLRELQVGPELKGGADVARLHIPPETRQHGRKNFQGLVRAGWCWSLLEQTSAESVFCYSFARCAIGTPRGLQAVWCQHRRDPCQPEQAQCHPASLFSQSLDRSRQRLGPDEIQWPSRLSAGAQARLETQV